MRTAMRLRPMTMSLPSGSSTSGSSSSRSSLPSCPPYLGAPLAPLATATHPKQCGLVTVCSAAPAALSPAPRQRCMGAAQVLRARGAAMCSAHALLACGGAGSVRGGRGKSSSRSSSSSSSGSTPGATSRKAQHAHAGGLMGDCFGCMCQLPGARPTSKRAHHALARPLRGRPACGGRCCAAAAGPASPGPPTGTREAAPVPHTLPPGSGECSWGLLLIWVLLLLDAVGHWWRSDTSTARIRAKQNENAMLAFAQLALLQS